MTRALNVVRKFFPQVKDVEDAKSRLTVEVTSDDAASEGVKDHMNCAMAEACKRSLHADGAIISVSTAYIIYGDKAVRYSVPESVGREVTSFDRNGAFLPGTYTLGTQAAFKKLGKRNKGRNKIKSRKHRHRGPQLTHHTEGIRSRLV